MDEKKIQALLDRMEIIDVENRYATGVDTRDGMCIVPVSQRNWKWTCPAWAWENR